MPVKVTAIAKIREGREQAFIDAARECIDASRLEPGVIRYDLWRGEDEPQSFTFDELFVDEAAMHRHVSSPHVARFGEAAGNLFAEPPMILVTQHIDVSD